MSSAPPAARDEGPFAAVDLGSNSFHLIIARFVDGALQPLVKDKQPVRLVDGMGEDRLLTPEAMERATEVLASVARTLAEIEPDAVRVVGTYALRRARNRPEFRRRIHRYFPQPFEVLSGDEEARLIYQGVAHTTPHEGRRLVVDIGGGSTEFIIGEHFDPLELSSLPMGCVSYTDRYFADGAITREAFEAAQLAARQRLEVIDQRFRQRGWESAIGTSGSARAIALLLGGGSLESYPEITPALLRDVRDRLLKAGRVDNLTDVEESRRAVLPAGLAILIAVFDQLQIERMHISDAALREGVLYELNERLRDIDIRQRTVNSLKARYHVDVQQARRVRRTALELFVQASELVPRRQRELVRRLLVWACELHEIGLDINRRRIQQHSAYVIENSEMPGFSEEEQKILALAVSLFRKRVSLKSLPSFDLLKPRSVLVLVLLLRIATLLNIRRISEFVPSIGLHARKLNLELQFPSGWLEQNPLVVADLDLEREILRESRINLEFR